MTRNGTPPSLTATSTVTSGLVLSIGGSRSRGGRAYYFGMINVSLALGVVAGLFGYSRPVWKPRR